jgi:hypothetical protein
MRLQTVYVMQLEESSQGYSLNRDLLKCPHSIRWSHSNQKGAKRLYQRFAVLGTILKGRQQYIMIYWCRLCPTEVYHKMAICRSWIVTLEVDLPPVVGSRRTIRSISRRMILDYESPRDRFEEFAFGKHL